MNAAAERFDGRVRAPRSRGSSASDRSFSERGTAPTAPLRRRRAAREATKRTGPASATRYRWGPQAGELAEVRLALAEGRPRLLPGVRAALTASVAAAAENVTAFASTPKGGTAAANQPQTASATKMAPMTAAPNSEVKIPAFACRGIDIGRSKHRHGQLELPDPDGDALEPEAMSPRSSGAVVSGHDDRHPGEQAVMLSRASPRGRDRRGPF